ncbi:hypothetical protein [Actinomadura sp. HBU206391]|nr:hypothetical protein [Actinomadura sp. HBU206391]MBC6458744.1 hypothetical protein [Actinomadura sp. HBU206391]
MNTDGGLRLGVRGEQAPTTGNRPVYLCIYLCIYLYVYLYIASPARRPVH